MTASWDSLYLRSADASAVAAALRGALTALDYTLFDPFAPLPGPAYPRAVRLFVAPAQDGWVRVLGAPDTRALPALSAGGLCLYAALSGAAAHIAAWVDGAEADLPRALQPYARPGCDLAAALANPTAPPVEPAAAPDALLGALPPDVQPLADRVNLKQAQGMLDRFSGGLLKRAGADPDAEAAARALAANAGPDWNSPGGSRIRALMACLTIAPSWREPDFTALRDAYQLHLRRRRRPDARLYPGDADALARVPDALAYTPVYAGRSDG
ncbi:MAG: hypothetical protein BroJett033_0100 [Chloroflexota bacterium]|nr:MAG: hypothetical protein BroJett033_0100 [Chloroflexota bacterium]